MSIYNKIDEIGEYIQQAQVIPVLNQKLLDTDYLMKCLEELYASIPQEIKDSRDILEKQEAQKADIERNNKELLEKTKSECEKMLQQARNEASRILDENELKNMVEEEARRIKSDVLEEADAIRKEVVSEVDEIRRRSLEHARELEEKARYQAKSIKQDAENYAEEVLNHIDSNLMQIQSVTKNGRKFLSDLKEKDLLQAP